MPTYAFWRRAVLVALILLNAGTAAWVGLDLYRRLASSAAAAPHGAAEPSPLPTAVPRPTLVVSAPSPSPHPSAPTATPTLLPANFSSILVSDDRFSYEPDFYGPEIQAFLEAQGSVLAQTTFPLGAGSDTFAHVLSGHCIRYGLNPKVVLALLEIQSGLVRASQPSAAQSQYAFGYRNSQWQGLEKQLQWATYTLAEGFHGEQPGEAPVLTDGNLAAVPGEANAGTRALLRLLAYTADAERYAQVRSDGAGSFLEAYRQLFGEDPRLPLPERPEPATEGFLWTPFSGPARTSSYFDHEYPIYRANGDLLSYTGERGYQSYDGHDGWDYVLDAGKPVLAAAAGRVVFAGWLDTLCPTLAGLVVLDHGQGYRTLYWHLQSVQVAEGTAVALGQQIGTVGSTGCSTGPHLHFGVEFLGRDTDPYGWCGSEAVPDDPWAAHPGGTASRWLWAERPSPCPVPAGAVVVDDQDEGFSKSPALWNEAPQGYRGHAYWTVAVSTTQESTHRVVWQPVLPSAGRYFLYAHIPWYDTGLPDTAQARYRIRYAGGEATVAVDQAHAAGQWAPLGAFFFVEGARGYVYLDEISADPGTTVWFDAVVWVRD